MLYVLYMLTYKERLLVLGVACLEFLRARVLAYLGLNLIISFICILLITKTIVLQLKINLTYI